MPAAPKLATFPAIRGALKFYQVASISTGTIWGDGGTLSGPFTLKNFPT